MDLDPKKDSTSGSSQIAMDPWIQIQNNGHLKLFGLFQMYFLAKEMDPFLFLNGEKILNYDRFMYF